MKLSFYTPPYNDELLYSWINRLAKENSLPLTSFMNAYLGMDNSRLGGLKTDVRASFVALYNHLPLQQNAAELYLSLSTLAVESLSLSLGQQTRIVNRIFRPRDILNPPINYFFNTLRICPDCIADDIQEYGEAYLHRAHQIPGVHTCHKHHKPLFVYVGNKNHECEYDLSMYEEDNLPCDISILNKYSDFAYDILRSNVSSDLDTVRTTIISKLIELYGRNWDKEKNFQSTCKIEPYKSLLQMVGCTSPNKDWCKNPYIKTDEIIVWAMLAFTNSTDFIAAIQGDRPLISEYQCPACKNLYYATPQSIEGGWGCPTCDTFKTPTERYKKLVSAISDDEYVFEGEWTEIDQGTPVYHKKCDNYCLIKPREFLFNGARCQCESKMPFKEAFHNVAAAGNFKLIEFNGIDKPCTITAMDCGHSFAVSYRQFLKSPKCRICNPKCLTTEILAKRIREQSNGEYELVGEFVNQNTKIKILHHKCGEITEYSPRYYEGGAVCPICDNRFSDRWDEMFQVLQQYKEEFGHVNVPKRMTYQGKSLGRWCQSQRDAKKNNNLSAYREQKMLTLGFIFDTLEDDWINRFNIYVAYVKATGNLLPSRRTIFNGDKIGNWVWTQRRRKSIGKLSESREAKLLSINPKFFDQ